MVDNVRNEISDNKSVWRKSLRKLFEYSYQLLEVISYLNLAYLGKKSAEMVRSLAGFYMLRHS